MNINKDLALFYGILLGDGCLSKTSRQYTISISGNIYDDKPFFDTIISPLIQKFRGKETEYRIRDNQGKIEFNFSDKNLFLGIKELGFPVGKKGPSITIPKIFYEKKLIKYIIQGFFATDGSLVLTKNPNKLYPRIELRAIHKGLVRDVHKYLVSRGMSGAFYFAKRKTPNKWIKEFPQYRFQFNGRRNLEIFRQRIGFVNQKQEDKYQRFVDYSDRYDKAIKGIPVKQQKHYRIK